MMCACVVVKRGRGHLGYFVAENLVLFVGGGERRVSANLNVL